MLNTFAYRRWAFHFTNHRPTDNASMKPAPAGMADSLGKNRPGRGNPICHMHRFLRLMGYRQRVARIYLASKRH